MTPDDVKAEKAVAEAIHRATIHACPELDTTYCETMDECYSLARAAIAAHLDYLTGLGGVSDEEIVATLRAHEIGSDPRTNSYECECGWRGSIVFSGRPEAEAHRSTAVRSLLARHAAVVTADLRAEVERLHTWEGLLELLDEHWPADIFPTLPDDPKRDNGPRIVSLIRSLDAVSTAAGEAAADRDAYRAEVEALRAEVAALSSAKGEAERQLAKAREFGIGEFTVTAWAYSQATATIDRLRHFDSTLNAWEQRANAAEADLDAERERVSVIRALCDAAECGSAEKPYIHADTIRAALAGDA